MSDTSNSQFSTINSPLIPPGYKLTEVGVIPEDWKVSSVGQEFEIKLGKMLDAEKNVGVPKAYIGNKAVQWGRIDINDLPTVPMTRADIESFRLQKGDLLVCEGGEVGRAALWDAPIEECYYQKALHRLRPIRSFDSRLMVSLLRLWADRGLLTNYVTQTSIAHLPREKFVDLPMPVPPLPEQRAIADALSDVDGLLGGLDRLIAKKRDLKRAAMQQLLTGQTRLPGFHGERPMKRLGEVADVKTGPFGSSLHERDYVREGTPIITVEHLGEFGVEHFNLPLVSDADRQRLRAYSLEVGDIVFSRVGSVDRNALIRSVEAGWLFSGRLLRVRPNKQRAYAPYLSYQFHGETFKSAVLNVAVGQTMACLNTQILKALPVSLPSLPEQAAIAAVLSDMDAEIAALEQRREKTRALKQAMMQELLTGRTRLVNGEWKMENERPGKPNIVKDKSFAFALRVVKLSRFLQAEKKEFVLSKQALRSGTAIGALVREAEHAQSKADFVNKMSIALKEANETDYWLDLLHQSGYISQESYESIHQDIQTLIKLLVSIVKTSKARSGK